MKKELAIRLNPLLKALFLDDFSVFGFLLLSPDHPFTKKIDELDLFDFKQALSVYEKFFHARDGEVVKLDFEEIFIEYAVINLSSKAWLTDIGETCFATKAPAENEPYFEQVRDIILRHNSIIIQIMKKVLSADPHFRKRVEQLEAVLPVE